MADERDTIAKLAARIERMAELDAARLAGAKACRDGLHICDCPYSATAPDASLRDCDKQGYWLAGYDSESGRRLRAAIERHKRQTLSKIPGQLQRDNELWAALGNAADD